MRILPIISFLTLAFAVEDDFENERSKQENALQRKASVYDDDCVMCIATGSNYCIKDLSVYPYLLDTVVEEKQCLIKSKECPEHHIGLEGIM